MQKEQQQLAALIKGKKVAFIGAGVSHKALIKEFVELGAHVTLCDQKKSVDDFGDYAATIRELGIDLSLGENYLEGFKGQDIIMRTPGFVGYFEKPLQDAMAAGTMVTSEVELFFDFCPCEIVCVTGSDGKTGIKEGVAVAITGAPNVGKSTLLNRLLNEERVLVSDIAGTTRDVIEERINIDGVVFRFLDTAGIRATDDRLEQMGIQRTMSSIERAQIVIYMTDAARLAAGAPVAPEFPLRADQKLLVLVNKTDTAPDCPLPEGTIGISARNGDGIESLRRILRSFVDTEALYHGDAIVSNNRHYEALTAAGDALRRALDGLNNSLQTDLLSEEIRQVIHHVGSVTGRNSLASEEVLKHIFSKHCVGK